MRIVILAAATGISLLTGAHSLAADPVLRGSVAPVQIGVDHNGGREFYALPALRPSLSEALLPKVGDLRLSDASGLQMTVNEALRTSYSLRSTLHQANAAYQQAGISLAAFMPTLNATASLGEYRNLLGVDFTRPGRRTSFGAELSLPIFTSGRNYHTLQSSLNASLSTDYQYIQAEQDLAYEAVAGYLDLYFNRKSEQAIRRNLGATRGLVTSLSARQEAGDASLTDLAIGRAEMQFFQGELEQAAERRRESEIAYKSLVGRNAPAKLQLPSTSQILPANVEEAVRGGLEQNALIISAEYQSRAAEHTAKATTARYLPQVNLTAAYQNTEYRTLGTDNTESVQFGLQLTMPIVAFDAMPAIQQGRDNASAAYYQALDMRRNVERDIRRHWNAYRSAEKTTTAANRRARHLRAALLGTREEYEAGLLPVSEVLQRQIELTRAEIEAERSKAARAAAAYRIALSSSKLTFETLGL